VQKLYSPVSPKRRKAGGNSGHGHNQPEAKKNASPSASATPSKARFESSRDVQVDKSARPIATPRPDDAAWILSDMAIDITQGTEASVVQRMARYSPESALPIWVKRGEELEVIKPVAAEATNTMKDLQQTAQNLNRITDENSELNLAAHPSSRTFGPGKTSFGSDAPDSALRIRSPTSKKSAQPSRRTTTSSDPANTRTRQKKLKGGDHRARACGYKHQAFSENDKKLSRAPDLAHDKKYAEASPTPAPGQGTITVAQKLARASHVPRANSHTYEQPLGSGSPRRLVIAVLCRITHSKAQASCRGANGRLALVAADSAGKIRRPHSQEWPCSCAYHRKVEQ